MQDDSGVVAPACHAGVSRGRCEAGAVAGASSLEVELKLDVGASGLRKLRRSRFWRDLGPGRPRRVDSLYYDTPDGELRALGLTLRLRWRNRRTEQTIKSMDTAAGLFSRREWTSWLRRPMPDLSAVQDGLLRERLRHIRPENLEPVFESRVRRTVKILTVPGGAVEIALDEGEVVAGERSAAVAEVELELKAGDPVLLLDTALGIDAVTPARIQLRTKPELGFALAAGGVPAWVKAEPVALAPGMTAEDGLAAIVVACVRHLLANDAAARTQSHVEGVHQVRVALRRLRSVLRMYRPLLPPEQYRVLAGELRGLAGALGPARDLDVFFEELLEPVLRAHEADDPGMAALLVRARAARDEAQEAVRGAVGSRRYTKLLLDLLRWQATRAWREQPLTEAAAKLFLPLPEMASALLAKRHRAVLRRGRNFRTLTVAQRHELRIALKKLRYATDFFAGLYAGRSVKRYLKSVAALQDGLGHLNDVATAGQLLASIAPDDAPPAVVRAAGAVYGWHMRGVADVEPQLIRDWRAFSRSDGFWDS